MNDITPPPPRIIVALRDCVSASQRNLGGRHMVVLHNEQNGKFFHLGAEESIVAALLDGHLEITEVAERMQTAGIVWSPEDLKSFVAMLIKSDLASIISADGQQTPPANQREPTPPRTPLQLASITLGTILSQRIPFGNADSVAARLLPWLHQIYSRSGMIAWAVLVAVAGWIALDHQADIGSQCRQLFSPQSWPLLACVGLLVKVVHEVGHAVAAKRLGVRIGSVGITLFLFAPLAYVDVTNAWKLSSRWSRVQIALGGVYLESWLAALATFMFVWLDDGFGKHLAAQVMLIAGPATWLINANPLLRLDGYYALSDATDIPNLRMHGRKRWAALFDHWLLGEKYQASHLIGWRKPFATAHAAASVVFQFAWTTGIIVTVSSWTSAVGTLLACVAFIAWVVMPMIQWWLRHWNAAPTDASRSRLTRRRMTTFATTIVLLVSSILSARNPFAYGVPVVVQHRDEQVGRAATAGFVTAVWVRGNQYVRQGELLVEITDENLVLKRAQMSDELALNMAKYRQLQNSGRLAEAEAANETAKQLRYSIDELDQALAASQIVASRDGIVVSEQPEKWLGRYAKRGEVLVRVAEPNDKELLVAIKEGDLSAYNLSVERGRPLAARIRGGTTLVVEPAAAQPRFGSSLPHKSLAATYGGDIPVIPDATAADGIKAAMPIGAAMASISPSQSLAVRAGQRGLLYLSDDQTVFTRLRQLIVGEPR